MNLPSVINESSLTYEQPSNAIFLKSRRFEDIKYDTERGLHGDYLATTWRPLGDHLATTWQPLGDHLVTTWWPLGDHLVTTWWLLGDYLETPWWLLGDHLATTWWPLGIWGTNWPIWALCWAILAIWGPHRTIWSQTDLGNLSIFGASFIDFWGNIY